MIETKKHLKTIIESNFAESIKVKLLSELAEDLIKYAEGLDRIHQQFKENTNKIFKQFEDRD